MIGTTADGLSALGNGTIGVSIGAPGNTVGGTATGARNVISGNHGVGLDLFGSQSSGNLVQGNYIGTNVNGTEALGNGADGVLLNGGSHDNIISAGNVISGNGLPPGTVSLWRAEGDAHDSVSGNNGTLQGGATFGPGISGQAFSFDGINSFVRIPDSTSLNPTNAITVEAWINPSSHVGSTDPIIKKAGEGLSPDHGYALEFAGDNVIFYVFLNGIGWRSSASAPAPLGQWSHVAGVYDGSTIRLYVNGALIGSPTSAPGGMVPSANELDLGHDPSNPDRWYHGRIDEAAIYSRALSAAEIQTIYQAQGANKVGGFGNGAELASGAMNNVVQGNYIGTNANGTAALGNGYHGLLIAGTNNTVGGTTAGERNVISGNVQDGVAIDTSGTGNQIRGN